MTTPHTPESDRALIERLRDALQPLAGIDLRPDDLERLPDGLPIYARDKSVITVGDVRRARSRLTEATARLAASDRPDALSDLADEIEATYPTADATNLREFGKTTPPAEAAKVGELPGVCDGKEQDAFEAWAKSRDYDMSLHPLHWLFLNGRTYAARDGWKAGLIYGAEKTRAAIAALQQPSDEETWGDGDRITYSSRQETNCAGCGVRKHTPLRVDWMGGYVCLTCIDEELEKHEPAGIPSADVRQRARELLAQAYIDTQRDYNHAAAIREGKLNARYAASLAAIETALAQPQQAGGRAVAVPMLGSVFLRWSDDIFSCPRDVHVLFDDRNGNVWVGHYDKRGAFWGAHHPKRWAAIPTLAAPTLPDVSEADVDVAEQAWDATANGYARFMVGSNWRDCLRAALESYRASLMTGEVKP